MTMNKHDIINPFLEDVQIEADDRALLQASLEGDRQALEKLIRRHQAWIYNIALRMVWDPQDAEDVTQEVLIKIITKLSTYRHESQFRTWIYRIVANHVINMKKRRAETKTISFSQYWNSIDATPDMEPPDPESLPIDFDLLLEEIKIHCMMAMLLCLDRKKRLVFILGDILEINARIGSEILEISWDYYRQILSRARKLVYGFMKMKCGLIDVNNPCHCHRKVKALLDHDEINPQKLRFSRNYIHKVKAIAKDKYYEMRDLVYAQCQLLFREQPFQNPPDYADRLREMIESDQFQKLLDIRN